MSFSPICKAVLNTNAFIELQALNMAAIQVEARQEVEDCIREMGSEQQQIFENIPDSFEEKIRENEHAISNEEYVRYWKRTDPSKTQENLADAAKGDEK